MPCVEITRWRGYWSWWSGGSALRPSEAFSCPARDRWLALASLVLVLLCWFVPAAQAEDQLLAQAEWVATHQSLSPAEALALDFQPAQQNTLNLGPFRGEIWLRLRVDGRDLNGNRWLSVRWPYFRDFRLYLIGPEGPRGKPSLLELRESSLPEGLFSMPSNPGRLLPSFSGEREFLVRLRADGPAALRVTLGSLEEERTRALIRYLSFGVYLGAMLGMAVYSLFLMLAVRERTYLGYAAFLAVTVLYIGVRYNILTPMLPDMFQSLPPVAVPQLAVALMALTGVWFVRRFLRTAREDSLVDYSLTGTMAIALLLMPASIWLAGVASFLFVAAHAVVTVVLIVWAAWRAICRGFTPAFHLLVGWMVFAAAVIFYLGMMVGWLPYVTWLTLALPIGSLAQALLLAFALGSRIRHKQREETALERERDRYRFLSEQDGLTGLFNRRSLDQRLAHAVAAASRNDEPLSLIVLDTDLFKDYNDRYGHLAGDDALRCLAGTMRATVRHEDMCFRYGGEEFVVLLPGQDLAHATVVAERIREAYRRGSASELGPGGTVSLGVAEFREGDTANTLLARADAALYRAKEQGRDRVELAH